MEIEKYESLTGLPMVAIYAEDGSVTSMPETIWDELQAAKEAQSLQGGIN